MDVSKVDLHSQDITQETLKELKQLIPSAFREGKIDFEALKMALGDIVEPNREFYNFTWAGKSEAFRTLQKPSHATMKPDKNESVDFENTENIFIEGDNLEVLKLLQKTYHDKIKMIYIDPPYNKDKDFVYPDRWSEGIKSYKEYCNFVNEGGNITTTDDEATNATGRKHSKWLTMMYPRLFLARNLLKEDGVIFISIDDDEVKNLRMICDEIFGEENFVGQFIKQSKIGGGSDSKHIATEHEYILTYSKNISFLAEMFEKHNIEYLKRYKEEDDDGKYFWDTFARPGLKNPINYDIVAQDGAIINGDWIWSKKRFEQAYKKGKVRIVKKENGMYTVHFKQYLNVNGKKPRSMTSNFGGTYEGKKEVAELLKSDKIFSYPKSTKHIIKLLEISTSKDDIILDFFAGSGTTAHAVMALNADDGGTRKCISVQLPEPTDEKSEAYKAGYKTISQITKERIKRAGKKIQKENPDKNIDTGFKVFKLDVSNFKQWDKNISDTETLKQSLMEFENNVVEGSDKTDMLYELLLKKGLDLNSKIEKVNMEANEIFIVDSDMYVCMDDKITKETIDKIIEARPKYFIVLDKAFEGNDQLKTNTYQTFKTLYESSENPFETV